MKPCCNMLGLLSLLLPALVIFAADQGDAARGKEIFGKRCATCHGSSGEGREAIAKALNVKMAPLSSREVQSQNDAALGKIIREGKGRMKPIKPDDLPDAEINSVIAFLRSLKK